MHSAGTIPWTYSDRIDGIVFAEVDLVLEVSAEVDPYGELAVRVDRIVLTDGSARTDLLHSPNPLVRARALEMRSAAQRDEYVRDVVMDRLEIREVSRGPDAHLVMGDV